MLQSIRADVGREWELGGGANGMSQHRKRSYSSFWKNAGVGGRDCGQLNGLDETFFSFVS